MQHIDPGKGERLGIKPSQLDHLFKEGFMETKICPYLYLVDDPSSCKDFPYEGNACHRVKKPVPVKLSYQKSHCLTESHTRCAGYITGWETGGPCQPRRLQARTLPPRRRLKPLRPRANRRAHPPIQTVHSHLSSSPKHHKYRRVRCVFHRTIFLSNKLNNNITVQVKFLLLLVRGRSPRTKQKIS